MKIIELKSLDTPWLDLGLELDRSKQRCPLHGGHTLAINRMDSGIITFRCFQPNCRGNTGGTITEMHYWLGLSPSIEDAAVDLLCQYGKLDDAAARLEVRERFATGKRAINKLLLKMAPKGAPMVDPPTAYYTEEHTRKERYPVEFDAGDGKIYENYPLTEASNVWIAPARYGGQDWAIAVLRWNVIRPDGTPDKVVRPFTRTPGGTWLSGIKHIERRPLYKLDQLEKAPLAPVIVVEGEKCMDALSEYMAEQAMLGNPKAQGVIVTSAIGGANGTAKTDWSIINGRKILVCPDCDKAGIIYAREIAAACPHSQVSIAWPHESRDKGDGYDIADLLADNPACDFWALEQEPISWNSLLEQIRQECDTVHVDRITQLLHRIHEELRPDPLVLDELLGRIRRQTHLSAPVLKQAWQQIKRPEVTRGWENFFTDYVMQEHFQDRLLWEDGYWWRYNGVQWLQIPGDDAPILSVIDTAIAEVWDAEEASWSKTLKGTAEVMRARAASPEPRLKLRADPDPVMNCLNVELWLDDKGGVSERPHKADSYLTHSLATIYDPKATCPNYDKLLDTLFRGSKDLINFWDEIAGYLIQPRHDLKHYFMLQGSGNNGKTTLMRVLAALAGRSVAFKDINTLEERFGLTSLIGKLFVVDDDVNSGTVLPDGLLKKISEAKEFTLEHKGKPSFEAVLYAAPVLLTNQWPSTKDLTPANLERAICVPFSATIPKDKRDPRLLGRIIQEELPGVLNRCLAGLRRLRARGRFDRPREVELTHMAWLADAHQIARFVLTATREEIVADGDQLALVSNRQRASITAQELYEAYQIWCQREHVQERHRFQRPALRRALEGMGFECSTTSNREGGFRLWGRILLKDDELRDD